MFAVIVYTLITAVKLQQAALVGCQGFEIGELGVQQGHRHEVASPLLHTRREDVPWPMQVQEPDITAAAQHLPVPAFERGRGGTTPPVSWWARNQWAMACNHGQRSSSVSGIPADIFSMFAGGWKVSASAYAPPRAWARRFDGGLARTGPPSRR